MKRSWGAIVVGLVLSLLLPRCGAAQTAAPQPGRAPVADDELEAPPPPVVDGPRPEAETLPLPPASLQRGFTPHELETLALSSNPTLVAARARVDAARGRWVQAGMRNNPRLGYMGSEIGNDGQAGQQGAFVSQEFITAHKRQLRQGVAEQQIAAAEQQWAAQQFRVLSDVRVLCYRILIAEQRIEVLEQLLSVAERAVNRAQILLRGGEGPRSDYLEAQIVAERNRLELQRAHLRKEQLWRALAAVVGVPAIDPPQLVGTLDDALPRLDWDETRNRLISSSPLLTVAAAEVERTWREVELARAEVVPNVDLSLSVQRDNATRDTIASVTAGLPLPLWNRNQGEIRRAAAENVAAHENLRRLELNLQRQLSEEFLNYQNSRLSADRFAVTILPQARQNVELDLRGFEAGEVSYLELFTAQRILYQANLDYIDSLEQLWTSVQRIDNLLLGGSLAPPQADFSPGQ